MEPRYEHAEVEKKIYKQWEDSGYFNPDNLLAAKDPEAKPFTIIMPPPNANGALHAGHAMFITIEDIMTRYARMRGKKALWLPGTDHAGFETQVVYERVLEKEGRSRFDMTREELYKEIWDFTQGHKSNTENGLRSLGASCDWSREKFTLDPEIVKIVYGTFKRLSDDKLLYRGKRIVSWCSKHQTSFSDLEVEDVERVDPLYYFQYGPFVIATARPETKFGDKHVVVHPDDPRYAQYKDGDTIDLEWINGPITATVIKDDVIDMEFGTGAMTITPWHDATDFAIAERHGLEKVQVIDERGKLLPIAGEFAGMKITEARKKIVEKLAAKGLLVKTDENYKHVVRTCYKCGTVIEPQIKNQWFVKTKPLAERAIKAINDGSITFTPEHYKKICLHWLENIIDWNISRQIAWGIPIPAKLCDACGEGIVDIDDTIQKCPHCGGALKKDPDTFDTWFSSGQWPFATLGYPDGKDFKTFYPTDVMETAGEIIFFWVTRMIMLGLYATGDVPFKKVYLHGLVLDAKGQKMSKSKGNVINPMQLTEKYGTDALRIALIIGNTPGTSLALSEDRIRGYRNFSTKIWNIARFIQMNKPQAFNDEARALANTKLSSREEIKELEALKMEVTKHIDDFEFHLAGEKLYHYIWHTLADKIIEAEKKNLADGTDGEKSESYALLEHLLLGSLTMLHPFMPFITEEVYQIFRPGTMLMIEQW